MVLIFFHNNKRRWRIKVETGINASSALVMALYSPSKTNYELKLNDQ